MTENGNKPAYPILTNRIDGLTGSSEIELNAEGMTKREYFAAMAMQGWLSSFGEDQLAGPEGVAKFSVKCADALISELAKEK